MFEKYFCSAPWIQARIRQNGNFEYCRHADDLDTPYNIRNINFHEYFQKKLSSIRTRMLNGEPVSGCHECYTMERNKKISGRWRDLIKTGIDHQNFSKTFLSSPYLHKFRESYENKGDTDLMPVIWQVEIGNYCNSGCVMCSPRSSSRLEKEFAKLGITEDDPKSHHYIPNIRSWVEHDDLVEKFLDVITKIKKLRYIHFIGGEPMMIPAFEKILKALYKHKLNETVTIGFTSNLTIYNQDIIDLLCEFKDVHIGMSIEALHSVNDYIRYPSVIENIKNNLDKFVTLSKTMGWNAQLRPAPNLLSILHLDTLFTYAIQHKIGIETCNFLTNPAYLKLSAVPPEIRKIAIEKIRDSVKDMPPLDGELITNFRNPATYEKYYRQEAQSFINYMENEPYDHTQHDKLVWYLKTLEKNRNNNVLDYIPEYEKFFRSINY